jgi:hypothetical protein
MDDFQNPSIFDGKRYFEWISGFDSGKVEVYVAELNEVIWFESGRNCPKEKLDFTLREISEQEYNLKKVLSPELSQVEQLMPLGNPEPPKVESNPIRIILDKQKKLDTIKVNYPVSIQIPSKKVIEFLEMMFDEDEVADEIAKFAIEKVNADLIEDFKTHIINYINDKLKGGPQNDVGNEKTEKGV